MKWIMGAFVIAGGYVIYKKPALQHFTPLEFGFWYPLISPALLLKLDQLREAWGAPIEISKAPGAIARLDSSESQHNLLHTGGLIMAVDVFPKVADINGGWRYMKTMQERTRFAQLARDLGFTGIGIYTDTTPGNMAHLDVRGDEEQGSPATWSRVEGKYLGIEQVVV